MFSILHADHEQNCSTTAVKVGSGKEYLCQFRQAFCPLGTFAQQGQPGGCMLEEIHKNGMTIEDCIAKAKDKNSDFKLWASVTGFTRLMIQDKIMKNGGYHSPKIKRNDPLLDIARKLRKRP
jgi:citrate synthase